MAAPGLGALGRACIPASPVRPEGEAALLGTLLDRLDATMAARGVSDPGGAGAPIEVRSAGVGRGAWTYLWAHRRKPHVHPLATPAGRVLTQVEPPDHPWQRGVWFVVKFVDGDNFWEEYDPAGWGVQRHDGPPGDGHWTVTGTRRARCRRSVEGDLAWIRPDRSTVAVHEHRRVTSTCRSGDDAYAVDWDVTLRVARRRHPRPHAVQRHVGRLLGPGLPGAGRLARHPPAARRRGRARPGGAAAVTLVRPVGHGADGAATVACASSTTPPTRRTPSPSTPRAGRERATARAGPTPSTRRSCGTVRSVLPAGEPLRFRYRLVVHDGAWAADRAEAAWQGFATP